MKLSRRGFLVTGIGLLAAGCNPPPMVRGPLAHVPLPPRRAGVRRQGANYGPTSADHDVYPPRESDGRLLKAIARKHWTSRGPITTRINTMGGISRITVHHEGWTNVTFLGFEHTRARLRAIRTVHTRDRKWADIGYHFIVDRAGRLWEGRSLAYQGAHVRDHNEHNLGLMLLGNFDRQRPSAAQLATLKDTLIKLRRHFHIPIARIYTHQEINPTACPGKELQAHMNTLRRGRKLV